MNDATRHDTTTPRQETQAQLCDRLGVNRRTMQRRWLATFGASFSASSVATPYQVNAMEVIFGERSNGASDVVPAPSFPIETNPVKQSPAAIHSAPEAEKQPLIYIYLPLAAASIASIANTWLICLHLSDGDKFSAGVMTAVFSGSAMCFIAAKAVGFWPKAVMWALIAFEAFTNTTGVYYGLLGRTGTPTRFLGMVTDILSSGTHWTAIGLGIAMSILIVSVQVVSIQTIINAK